MPQPGMSSYSWSTSACRSPDGARILLRRPYARRRGTRAAREQQGLSLDELSARTKIGLERLKAIEDEEVDRLPPVVYLKGFGTGVHGRGWSGSQRDDSAIPAASRSACPRRVRVGRIGRSRYVFDEPASSDEHDTLQERHVEELLPESLSGDLRCPMLRMHAVSPAPASTANRRPGAQYWSLQ